MTLQKLKINIATLRDNIDKQSKVKPNYLNFNSIKTQSSNSLVKSAYRNIGTHLDKLKQDCNFDLLEQLEKLFSKVDPDVVNSKTNLEKMYDLIPEVKEDKLSLNLPNEIKDEIMTDYKELQECHKHGLNRSAVILCGRILETSLYRKYYDITNNDLLVTAPGMSIGKLIAKLVEKNVKFDPGIDNQLHLINQIRVSSVHTKKQIFQPSNEQTQAIILFTIDILKKLF